MKHNPKILIAESEGIIAADIRSQLIGWGYSMVHVAESVERTFTRIEERCPNLVILDQGIKGNIDVTQAATQITNKFHIAVILLIDCMNEKIRKCMKTLRFFYCISKPFDLEELHSLIELAVIESYQDIGKDTEMLIHECVKYNIIGIGS